MGLRHRAGIAFCPTPLRQMRIECVKVCAPAQLQELVEGAHAALPLVPHLSGEGC